MSSTASRRGSLPRTALQADFNLAAMLGDGLDALKYPAQKRATIVACSIALFLGVGTITVGSRLCSCPIDTNWFRLFRVSYFLGFHGCILNVAAGLASLMIMYRVADSWHLRSACGSACCLILAGAFRALRLLREGFSRDLGCTACDCKQSPVHSFFTVAGHLPLELVFVWVNVLIWQRIRNCERASLIDIGATKLCRQMSLQFILALALVPFWLTLHGPDCKMVWVVTGLLNIFNVARIAATAIEAYRDLEGYLGAPLLHSRQTSLVEEVSWAKATIHFQKLGVFVNAASIVYSQASMIGWYLYLHIFKTQGAYVSVVYICTIIIPWTLCATSICLSLLLLTGALFTSSDEQRASADVKTSRRVRRTQRKAATARWRPHEEPGWQVKVEELASRGLRLRSLLRFYKGLGTEYMLNFDPKFHTTTDVVRAAIIPMSKDRGCGALVLEEGPRRPQNMVTHNWENRFRDLVAAIIADALDDTEYGRIGELMETTDGLQALEEWLGQKPGALDRAYWVCAFAINQHHGICHANVGRTDTVSGEPHAICDCGASKYLNITPPLIADGRSVLCEMNKFKDMMAFLAATDSRFAQVIAVDKKYALFDRAWCVCELAEASEAGMAQKLKISDMLSLEENEDHLRRLKVENMQASRKEDVEEILAGIPDVGKFNQRLQELIFDDTCGLISDCRRQDTRIQMAHIGRLARWQFATRQLLRRRTLCSVNTGASNSPPARAG